VRPRSLDDFLKAAHVPFTTFQHRPAYSAQQEAARSHVPGRSWAKTVICFAGDEPIAAVVPAHLMVDLERLRALAQAATLRLATERELGEICPDCELGAVSPFTSRWGLRVFVDQSFVGEPEMVFSAGTHTDAIRMHYGDFFELAHPIVGAIGMPDRRQTPRASATKSPSPESPGPKPLGLLGRGRRLGV
jgi:Ala-tRNA(Pro) deacylase